MGCEYPGDKAEADHPDVLLDTLPVLVDRGVRLVLSLVASESNRTSTDVHEITDRAIVAIKFSLCMLHISTCSGPTTNFPFQAIQCIDVT